MLPRLARTLVLSSALAAFGVFGAAPSALAYGNAEQWQVGFSGTCSSQSACPFGSVPAQGATGFWGWCAFGGSNGSSTVGTTGTTADCQVTTYFGPGTSFHIDYNVTGWIIQPFSPIAPPGLPDFLLTSGTVTLSGPGVPTGFPVHVPIPFPFPIVGCPPMVCDTGIPPVPGHFSFHPSPGVEFNIQVNQLP
jgi:hypothetical protein